ncbi:DUF4129 domain-containing protein, partial [Lysinibacillus sp. D4B1_S16]|uniref:DUF4129 domain-containing protein n=1 Tax=Lysinibacillus sp. D4B1_S16 TaxID=2941231 RepID=UPI0037CBAB48
WVEAYIPGTGWLEFEPTIGFSGNVNIDYDIPLDTFEQEEIVQPEQNPEQPQKKEQVSNKEQSKSMFSLDMLWTWLKKFAYVWIIVFVLLMISGIALYLQRKTWLPKMHVRVYRKKTANWSTFDSSYHILLKQLSRIGLRMRDGETLHMFAERVDASLETDQMQKLTAVYEQHVYGKDKQEVDFIKLKESWEYLI